MTDEVAEKVIAIIAEQALVSPSDIALTATPQEVGIDSLGLVETIFAIEEAFDVSVPFNANEPDSGDFDISSVAAIIAAVKDIIASKG